LKADKKVSFISLGCSKNQVDLEYLMGSIESEGFSITNIPEESDAIVINTCGFIEPAVNEAIENILEMHERKKDGAKLIVTGCMSQRFNNELKDEIPEIDFMTGVGDLEKVVQYLRGDESPVVDYGDARVITNADYYAYLKVSEGCNNRCSYCAIPGIRGGLVSIPIETVVKEAKQLVSEGIKELIVVSQDNTKYGSDIYGETKIVQLLKELEKIDGDFKIRVMYMNPDGMTEDLINTICRSNKILSYFDIPVQHYSDKMLKAMKRKSDSKTIDRVYESIRKADPEAILRTTMIVGFPGEESQDFEELVRFINEKKPDFAGFFPYYREQGTEAYDLGEPVGKRETNKRIKALQKIQKTNTNNRLKILKKNDIICFVEGTSEQSDLILEGRAIFQAPDIDGKAFFIDGIATDGYGPYTCRIKRIIYPDIYCEIIEKSGDA